MTDQELIARFSARRDQDAFRELVNRHLPLVYAAARRQLQDGTLAEDVSQAVFLVLAQRAGTLSASTVLPAWLLVTTRYACRDVRKSALRRQRHEHEAAAMTSSVEVPPPESIAIAPHLDDALAALGAADRDAIVLRYLQGQPMRAVGASLAISESAAEKRVARALDKLRAFFAGRNIVLSINTLSPALAWHAFAGSPPPAALGTSIVAAASAPAAPATAALVKSTLHALFWTHARITAASAAVLVTVAAAGSAVVLLQAAAAPADAPPTAPRAVVTTASATPGFTPVTEISLMSDGRRQITFLNLDEGKSVEPPFPVAFQTDRFPSFDLTPEFQQWIEKSNISLIVAVDADNIAIFGIRLIEFSHLQSHIPDFFNQAKPNEILEETRQLDAKRQEEAALRKERGVAEAVFYFVRTTQRNDFNFPVAGGFRIPGGTCGVYEITQAAGRATLRYKRVLPAADKGAASQPAGR